MTAVYQLSQHYLTTLDEAQDRESSFASIGTDI